MFTYTHIFFQEENFNWKFFELSVLSISSKSLNSNLNKRCSWTSEWNSEHHHAEKSIFFNNFTSCTFKQNYLYEIDVITASKKIYFFWNNNETFYISIHFTELYHESLFKLIESSHIVNRSKDNWDSLRRVFSKSLFTSILISSAI